MFPLYQNICFHSTTIYLFNYSSTIAVSTPLQYLFPLHYNICLHSTTIYLFKFHYNIYFYSSTISVSTPLQYICSNSTTISVSTPLQYLFPLHYNICSHSTKHHGEVSGMRPDEVSWFWVFLLTQFVLSFLPTLVCLHGNATSVCIWFRRFKLGWGLPEYAVNQIIPTEKAL